MNALNIMALSGSHLHLISDADHERGEGHCIECGALVVCHDR